MYALRFIIIYILAIQTACAQEIDKPILLLNPTVNIGTGEVVENAALAFENENIILLADARLIRLDLNAYRVIEAQGLHIYPAAVTDTLPSGKGFYYLTLEGSSGYMLTANTPTDDNHLPNIQEGGEATFVVADNNLDFEETTLRYIVVKGQMKAKSRTPLTELP